MKLFVRIIFLCTLLSLSSSALSSSASLSAGNKDGIEVKRERVFTGKSLYGFMNGGADLYLEYGVEKLTTRELVYLGEEYTLDIYEMPTPEDAFGIYSIHVFKCIQADVNNKINCLSSYQLQTVVGNCYVSLVFISGSEKAKTNANELILQYTSDIEGEKIVFPEQISISGAYSGVLKFLRGSISLSGAQFSLSTLLQGVPFTGVWLVPTEKEDENRALILFENTETMTSIREKIDSSDIIDSAETWLFIRCKEPKKPTNNSSPFGF